jgi:hypothetical protein
LESFPYALTAVFVVLVIVSAVVIKKSNFLYSRPFGGIAIGLVGFIVLTGGVLTFTSLGERIERQAFGQNTTGRTGSDDDIVEHGGKCDNLLM